VKPITLYTANCRGDKYNALYPVKRAIASPDDLRDAVAFDQVFAEYKGGHRAVADFVRSDCLPFDCDNDHSDAEAEWKTPDDVEKAFPGVPFYVVYSRHHMRQKKSRGPRPRFHVIFPIDPITDGDAYAKLKASVVKYFPYFDTGAKDAARFFFGVKDPVVEMRGGDAP
jgi:hypothetical protein